MFDKNDLDVTEFDAVELAAELTIAWLGNQNNRAEADDVPAFLRTMHATISELAGKAGATDDEQANEYTPAASVRRSLSSKDHIISMIDGKPYKTLRRHLTAHGLTPEEYRQRYNLKPDYPMVAENYSARRSELAKKIGLGQKGRAAAKSNAQTSRAKFANPKRGQPKSIAGPATAERESSPRSMATSQ